MSATLARMGNGFADPVHGAQQAFRVLLGGGVPIGVCHGEVI